jgi:GT2 family glycosyltransferase
MVSKDKSIYFVVVNYNNHTYTIALCESLLKQVGVFDEFNLECIVVDNSTDSNDSTFLADFGANYSWINILSPGENLGYFAGLNHGLAELKHQGKQGIIVIGNNDLEFHNDFCTKLFTQKYPNNVFAICPSVITPEGYNQNPHILEKISTFRRFQFDIYFSHYFFAVILLFVKSLFQQNQPKKNLLSSVAQELHMGVGACYILTSSFLQNFYQLNCPTFLYGEEAFFSDQIHSKGGILYFEPSLIVFHAESATLSQIPKRKSYEYAREGYPLYRKLM